MKRLLLFFLLASCLAGCGQKFVYQRKPDPAQDAPNLPVKVAVVAFQDGTGDFTIQGSFFGGYVYNFAKTDVGYTADPKNKFLALSLPPAWWAKALAEDMIASGTFRAVKFMYAPSEVTDEDIVVEGALTKAYITSIKNKPDEFVLHLKVRRVPHNTVLWEGDAGRSSIKPPNFASDCIFKGCFDERSQGYLNGVMQAIFADVRLNIVRALAVPPEKKRDIPAQDSPDELIKRILGKP